MSTSRIVYPAKQFLRLSYRQVQKLLGGYGLTRFRVVRCIEGLVRAAVRGEFAEVLGHRMYLGAKDDLNLSVDGIYGPFETRTVQRQVRAGDVVVDIGANVGYYTLQFARLVGRDGRVFAFEPDPENFDLLDRNVRLNGYQNVTLERKAISDRTGKARFYLAEHKGDGRVYNSHDGRGWIEIEQVQLDEYFENHRGGVDFIKMDIQGAEPAALRGMTRLLGRHQTVKLLVEFWPVGLKLFGTKPAAFLRSLVELGFVLHNVDERDQRISVTSIAELVARYPAETNDTFNHTNLLCVRD